MAVTSYPVSTESRGARCYPPSPVRLQPAAHGDQYDSGWRLELAMRRLAHHHSFAREDGCLRTWGCCGPGHDLANSSV